jgi:hypothetical protein
MMDNHPTSRFRDSDMTIGHLWELKWVNIWVYGAVTTANGLTNHQNKIGGLTPQKFNKA